MPVNTRLWDASEHLDSPEAIAAYLDAAMEDGDPAVIAAALGDVARARGMTQIARETGLARESLYRALSADGKPEFGTVLKVLKSFGVRLSATPV
ncbi:addiction module antidote protein [Oceanibaculum nanhaiense]|jgi:probable addiction module antidote protein|uniref:addiction module antidote protein n=1 Tax=Oceanibaculum nanhaiense TaxID=1909734 RepID=UPI000A3C6AA3|nr:addiction module antidote protein [Oceanibaculum nanhaiense]MDM7945055.1 putative addiction module antidote protein [Oceanibaculum nanhaiense]|tara:strand:+ start:137 stop:421 length:285 start_codon:yes stop_codon:yes gene_type:complete